MALPWIKNLVWTYPLDQDDSILKVLPTLKATPVSGFHRQIYPIRLQIICLLVIARAQLQPAPTDLAPPLTP